MEAIGTVKSISTDGGVIVAVIESGSGVSVTGVVFCPLGAEFYPRVGDSVLYVRTSKEIVILAGLASDIISTAGEALIYSRKVTGEIAAKFWLKTDGSVRVENDMGFIEMSAAGQVAVNNNFTVDP